MFAVGLSQGPPHHYFYICLDKYIPGNIIINNVSSSASHKKKLRDCEILATFIYEPLC